MLSLFPRVSIRSSVRSLRCQPSQFLRRNVATAVDSPDRPTQTPLELYNERVASGRLRDDEHQRGILKSMESLYSQLSSYHPPDLQAPARDNGGMRSMISSWFGSSTSVDPDSIPQGIYLYGDVGCGKTMLMDLFYDTIPSHLSKKRLHFHQFMQALHKRQHQLKVQHGSHDADVMPELAWELSKEATVLCFDEFQVTDVADAMLLRRLIDMVLREDHGLVLFATSNRAPDDLYINGVQRESFIPCIEEIKKKTRVIYLDSPTDYRKIPRPISGVYYSPEVGLKYHSPESQRLQKNHIDSWFSYFSQGHQVERNVPIRIWGRDLNVPKCCPPYVAQFTFKELCGQPYAAGDYLALATEFESIIVTDIPYLSIESRDEVRRFITFLDAVYDNHGRLAVTGAAPFEDIFVEPEDIGADGYELNEKGEKKRAAKHATDDAAPVEEEDPLVKEHGFDKNVAATASLFAKVDEERFAFARALSRLKQMSTRDWVEHIPPRDGATHKRTVPEDAAKQTAKVAL